MSTEPAYTARFVGTEIIESGNDNVIKCPVYSAGALVTPSSATVTVYAYTSDVVVSAGSASITGSVPTYTLTSSALSRWQPSDGWRFEWAVTISGTVYNFKQYGSLVYRRLFPVVTDADLIRAHADLTRRRPSTVSSYQDYLDEAWAQVNARLINTGKRPWLNMDPQSMRECHMMLTLHLIFFDFSTGGTQTSEGEMAEHYRIRYEEAWSRLNFPQANPQDGKDARPGVRVSAQPSFWLGGTPASRRGWGTWP